MKRFLYLSHHWLGIALCALMAMWFFSGVVMMYVQYPALSQHERLHGLASLEANTIKFSAKDIIQSNLNDAKITQITLTSFIERPVYLIKTSAQKSYRYFADDGKSVNNITQQQVLNSANHYAARHHIIQDKPASLEKVVDSDQWTVAGYVNGQRPFYLVSLNDTANTTLYYSVKSGELIRDTSQHERVWNWLGANLHWIYFKPLRQHASLWYWLIVVVSVLALVSIISGAVLGIWRLRLKKPYKNNRITPYQGQLKLHHILGLLFLIPLTTYTYSGLMSMGSFGVAEDKIPYHQKLAQYQGDKTLDSPVFSLRAIHQAINQSKQAKELVWYWVNGDAALYSVDANSQKTAFDEKTPLQRQQQAAALLAGIMGLTSENQVLTHYDAYYYAHHQRMPTLPVLRLKFNDSDQSWFYVDLKSGQLLYRQTKNDRTMRWLYHGLHSLDFPWLIKNRPAWDIVVIMLSILGFVFSVSSCVIAWRYLNNPQKRRIRFFKKRNKVKPCKKPLETAHEATP